MLILVHCSHAHSVQNEIEHRKTLKTTSCQCDDIFEVTHALSQYYENISTILSHSDYDLVQTLKTRYRCCNNIKVNPDPGCYRECIKFS